MNPVELKLTILLNDGEKAEEVLALIKESRTNMPAVNLLANDGRFLGKIKIEPLNE